MNVKTVPSGYSRLHIVLHWLVFALIVGVIAFNERPDTLTLLGAATIVASGLYTLWRETRSNRANPAL